MTPKKKAQEIFNKMYQVDDIIGNYPMCFDTAKQCALIAVDEIIDEVGKLNVEVLHTEFGEKLTEINGEIRTNYYVFVIYWGEVKQEIINI